MAQSSSTLPFGGQAAPSTLGGGVFEPVPVQNASASRLSRIASRAVLGLAMLLLFATAALYVVRSSYADRVYPSVLVADVEVGGLTHTEARTAIEERASDISSTRITLSHDGLTWNPTLGELGVVVDTDASLEAAFAVGRESDARERVTSAIGLLRSPEAVALQLRLDDTTFSAWMDTIDRELGAPAADAVLVIEDGEVTIKPDVDGTVVDRAQARAIVVQSMQSLAPFTGDLPVVPHRAAVHVEDLEPAMRQLESALSKSITLTHGKKKWKLTPSDMGQFVVHTVEQGPGGGPLISIAVDRDALAGYLGDLLASEVNKEPRNAQVAWDFEKKEVFSVEKSVNGAKLKPLTLADAVTAAFFGEKKTVKVPITKVKPDVDSNNLGALGITTRLAVGDSNFSGSDQGRATNIYVGAALMNGTLVPPGADFSFNRAIGEITTEKGYVESLVVDGERIDRDIGGGICQVSTTVFRAAFFGGFPVTEWHPHRYRLGFYELDGYPPGLDASILQPEGDPFGGGDFRFTNPTDSWLLIESYVDGARVYVIIYGPELGWDVRISEPWYGQQIPKGDDVEVIDWELPAGTIMQTEYPQEGMDVFFQRTVFDKEGNQLWDRTFGTHFYARGNVYKVSPDMAGQSPAASS